MRIGLGSESDENSEISDTKADDPFYPGSDDRRPLVRRGSLSKLFSSDNILDETLLKIGWGRYQLLLLVIGSATAMLSAATINVPSYIAANTSWRHNAELDSFDVSIWVSAGSIGGLTNVIFVYLGDLYGRRSILIYSALFIAFINLCTAFADQFWILILQQALTSGPQAAVQSLSVVLMLEFSDSTLRGRVGLIVAVVMNWSVTIVSIAAYGVMRDGYRPQALDQFFAFTTPIAPWRVMYLVVSVPLFFVLCLFIFIPYESPRYLLKVGRYEEAWEVILGVIKRNNANMYEEDVPTLEQFQRASEHIVDEQTEDVNWGFRSMWNEFWDVPDTVSLLIATVCLYGTEWSFTGFIGLFLSKGNFPVYLILIFGSTVGPIPALFVVSCTVDRTSFGRIRYFQFFFILYTVSFFGMLCFLSAEAYLVFYSVWMFAYVPAASILAFYIPEIYPTRLRSFASGIFLCVPNLAQFFLNFIAAYTVDKDPRLFVAVYAVLSAIGVLASLRLKDDLTGQPMY